MRLAVVYHLPNPGGVTRFTHALLEGILRSDETVEIDYFVSERLIEEGRAGLFEEHPGVRLIGISDPDVVDSNLDSPSPNDPRPRVVRFASGRLAGFPLLHGGVRAAYRAAVGTLARVAGRPRQKHWYEFALTPEVVERLSHYDVVYLPFPYYLQPASIDAPIVATFHDLNHLYFPENFGSGLLKLMDKQLRFWTRRTDVPVASTRFIEADLVKHYPDAAGRTAVIFVAPYSVSHAAEPVRRAVLQRFDLADRGYWIYPSNNSFHKNLATLVQAADLIKRRDGQLRYPIVFTGFGTDGLGLGRWPSFKEVDTVLAGSSLEMGTDIRGLGFVTDEEVDALTRSAGAVVSSSLYEAGCGPALDAWQYGVPVAFSNIPPFLEQLETLGTHAWTFDPRDPADIAATLETAMADHERTDRMVVDSKRGIASYTWLDAAGAYLQAFARAREHRATGLAARRPRTAGAAAQNPTDRARTP